MNPKYENLHYIDLGASLRKFNDVINSRKQGDMTRLPVEYFCDFGKAAKYLWTFLNFINWIQSEPWMFTSKFETFV